jgi:tetratricopeptide (TPR) repeat protein
MNAAQREAELRRGRAAQDAGNLGGALKHFEAAIRLAPEHPVAYLWAADAQFGLGGYVRSLDLVRSGLALPCSTAQRSFGLQLEALCLLRLRKPDEALAVGQNSLRNEPSNPGNHRVVGQILVQAKRYKEAEAAFQRALELAPENLPVLLHFAALLKTHWRLDEARQMAERAALIRPDHIPVMLLRGEIAFVQDDLATALDLALWALSRNATDRRALQLLAQIKSRRSWLTKPYWWFKALIPRLSKLQITFWLFVIIALFVAAKLLLPAIFLAVLPPANTTKNIIVGALAGYIILCTAHVIFLTERERRQVKLKNF